MSYVPQSDNTAYICHWLASQVGQDPIEFIQQNIEHYNFQSKNIARITVGSATNKVITVAGSGVRGASGLDGDGSSQGESYIGPK